MTYLVNRTVIAARRLEIGDQVSAEDVGGPVQVERLLALGAIAVIDGGEQGAAPPVPDDVLRLAVINAIGTLPAEDFDQGGKPKVPALRKALPDHAAQIDATLRDTVWAGMQAAANAAS